MASLSVWLNSNMMSMRFHPYNLPLAWACKQLGQVHNRNADNNTEADILYSAIRALFAAAQSLLQLMDRIGSAALHKLSVICSCSKGCMSCWLVHFEQQADHSPISPNPTICFWDLQWPNSKALHKCWVDTAFNAAFRKHVTKVSTYCTYEDLKQHKP